MAVGEVKLKTTEYSPPSFHWLAGSGGSAALEWLTEALPPEQAAAATGGAAAAPHWPLEASHPPEAA